MISKKSYAQLEGSSRHKKASKIASILGCFVNFSKCDVLDIGVGSGHIASDLARKSKSLVGVDLYDERVIKSGYLFKKVDDEYLPFNNSDMPYESAALEAFKEIFPEFFPKQK